MCFLNRCDSVIYSDHKIDSFLFHTVQMVTFHSISIIDSVWILDANVWISEILRETSIQNITRCYTIYIVITKNHDFVLIFDSVDNSIDSFFHIIEKKWIYPKISQFWIQKLIYMFFYMSYFEQSHQETVFWIIIKYLIFHNLRHKLKPRYSVKFL